MRWILFSLLACVNFLDGDTNGGKTSSYFGRLRYSKTFVDKTLWLKRFLEFPGTHVILTGPQSYGKTANIEMMKEFFGNLGDANETLKIFEGTEIHTKERAFFDAHFKKYPLVHLNLRPLLAVTHRDSLREQLCLLFNEMRNVTDPRIIHLTPEEKAAKAKRFRERCVNEFRFGRLTFDFTREVFTPYNQTIIILLDNVDALAHAVLRRNLTEQEGTLLDFGQFLNLLLTSNDHVAKSFCTGNLFLDGQLRGKTFPDDDIKEFKFNEEESYARYFGLTELELEHLFDKFNLKEKLARVRSYYDGYPVKNSSIRLYNTISTTEFVKKGRLENYWADAIDPLQNHYLALFSRPAIGSAIEKALFGDVHDLPIYGRCTKSGLQKFQALRSSDTAVADSKTLEEGSNVFFNFLLETGYTRRVTNKCFRVTNEDTAHALGTTLVQHSSFYKNARNISSADSARLVEAVKLLAASEESVGKLTQAVQKVFAPGCSLVTDKRASMGGPLFALLAYTEPDAFETVVGPTGLDGSGTVVAAAAGGVVDSEEMVTPPPAGTTGPDLLVLRKDKTAILFALKREAGFRAGLDKLMAALARDEIQQMFEALGVKRTILLGVNLDARCNVTISYT